MVLRKGVALRKMRSHVPNPTVLLLRGSLEYHGGAGGLTSLERVTMEQVGWWGWKKGVEQEASISCELLESTEMQGPDQGDDGAGGWERV